MMRLSCLTLSYQNQFRAGKMDIFSFLTTCRAELILVAQRQATQAHHGKYDMPDTVLRNSRYERQSS